MFRKEHKERERLGLERNIKRLAFALFGFERKDLLGKLERGGAES